MYYTVFGFPVKSDVPLPELVEISEVEAANHPVPLVEVTLGPVPASLPDERFIAPWLSFNGTTCLYRVSDVGLMLVEGGSRITIDAVPGAPMGDLRTYLLGTGFGTILHQRGQFPLHVSAVLSPAGAIAFTGPSGAGKSTAAAEINARLGWPVICDDVAVLLPGNGRPMIESGVRRLRLWNDALDRLGWSTEGLARDIHREDKYLTLGHGEFVTGPQPLIGVYVIVPEGGMDPPEVVQGAERFAEYLNTVYRPFMLPLCGTREALHEAAARGCVHLRFWKGRRPLAMTVLSLVS